MIKKQANSNFNQALWLGISSVSTMLVSILSAAILSRFFDKAEYGTYKQIIFVYTTLLTVFQAGLPSVFSYFLPKYSHEAGKYIVNKINRVLFLLGVLLSLTIFFTSDIVASLLNNPELSRGLKLFSPFPIFTLPTLGLEGIYIVNKNTRFVAIYNTVTRLLMLTAIVLPVIFFKNTYETAIIGWGFASFIAFVIALCYKSRPYNDVENPEAIPGLLKTVLSYSLPIMGSSCVLMFYNSINQIVISRYFGVESFAEFSNGFMPLPFIAIIVNPIRQLLVPMISGASTSGDYEPVRDYYTKAVKEMALLLIPIIAFCMCYSQNLMVFLYGEQYSSSYIFFIIALIFNYFEIFPMQTILSGLGKTKLLFIFDVIFTILLYLVNIVLIKYGISSPVIVAIVFTVTQILLRYIVPYIYMSCSLKISPVSKKLIISILTITFHVAVAAFLTRIVSSFFSGMPIILSLLASAACFYAILLGSGYVLGLNYVSSVTRIIRKKK